MTEHNSASEFDPDQIAVSFDIDWAPDWIIDDVAARVVAAGVRATWFATHESHAISRLAANSAFEVGIHPNFMPGGTQGQTPREVLENLRRWFPYAKAARTHSLFQSERLLEMMSVEFGMDVDCSIHLPQTPCVIPHEVRYVPRGPSLIRIPHVFQDNMFMMSGKAWSWAPDWLKTPGLKVLDFHPVHVWLNSCEMKNYETLKARVPVSEWKRSELAAPDGNQFGAGWFLDHCLERLKSGRSLTISEIARGWKRRHDANSAEKKR